MFPSHDHKGKKEIKQKKESRKKVITKIMETYKLNDYKFNLVTINDCRAHICDKIIQYHLDNNLTIRKFQIVAYLDTICCRISKDFTKYYSSKISEII